MVSYADQPGYEGHRGWSDESYSPYQMALWKALDDAYYTHANQQQSTRHPSPHTNLNSARFQAWKARMLERYEHENNGRGGGRTSALQESDWPDNLWLYVYERMVAADGLPREIWRD